MKSRSQLEASSNPCLTEGVSLTDSLFGRMIDSGGEPQRARPAMLYLSNLSKELFLVHLTFYIYRHILTSHVLSIETHMVVSFPVAYVTLLDKTLLTKQYCFLSKSKLTYNCSSCNAISYN